ncbi:nuclear transport factor 2 family protein [Anabaena sp. FACHB-1237]|uniref:nuclear transport factor 2 family protein n=1 Tax=Anabaena sp. FACHB-1237 TaxID=2692769 RepID=UPI001680D745|nr:nuclear transport factor 2 family protein [Anabaena sp. FACHB-1237]MBD2136493.1 nuclear transport factor 2 family protein [Anabaena sp. FACHB-1237]
MPKITNLLIKRNKTLPFGLSLISLLLTISLPIAEAKPQNSPAEITKLLTQIDKAASEGNVRGVMQFYSNNFAHGDGLNRKSMEQALTALWKRYPQLQYSTKLESWKSEGNSIVAETITNITGVPSKSNDFKLKSTIKSRQRISGTKIVRQDILLERTELTMGSKPPKVEIKLPQQVKVGEKYIFDAIVEEPLGDDMLLGAALEEPIKPTKLLNPTMANLTFLDAGGLFKVGRAPSTPGSQWISAVIRRGENMTIITQRLNVVKK